MSKYYDVDPDDPEAPAVLMSYKDLRVGMHVIYANPAFRQPDGSYLTGGMDPPLVVDEIVSFGGQVQAVLNDGEWECNADNLAPDPDAR